MMETDVPTAEEVRGETEPTESGAPEPTEAGVVVASALLAGAAEETPAHLAKDGAQSVPQKDNGRLPTVEATEGGRKEGPPLQTEEASPVPAPPVPASCSPAEDAPKPRPSPASQPKAPDFYCVKWITWKGKRTPVIMQSENGPCPLLAIMNILFLQWKVKTGTGKGGTARTPYIEAENQGVSIVPSPFPGEAACPEGSGHLGRIDGLPR